MDPVKDLAHLQAAKSRAHNQGKGDNRLKPRMQVQPAPPQVLRDIGDEKDRRQCLQGKHQCKNTGAAPVRFYAIFGVAFFQVYAFQDLRPVIIARTRL